MQEDDDDNLVTIYKTIPFKVAGDKVINNNESMFWCDVVIQELWSEKINSKQVEINYTLALYSQILEKREIGLICNPAYKGSKPERKNVSYIIYVVKEDDKLWVVAKKYKTTADIIKQVNQVDKIEKGNKLLIIR